MLKMVEKNINIYKYKLSLSGRDDTKQAKSLIFIVVPQVEYFQKYKKKMFDVVIQQISSKSFKISIRYKKYNLF